MRFLVALFVTMLCLTPMACGDDDITPISDGSVDATSETVLDPDAGVDITLEASTDLTSDNTQTDSTPDVVTETASDPVDSPTAD